jgi:hypothetical protein
MTGFTEKHTTPHEEGHRHAGLFAAKFRRPRGNNKITFNADSATKSETI